MADMNYFQLQDPRLALSQQLLAEGTSTAPVQHWAQGLSRLAQALVGSKLRDQSQADQMAAQGAFNAGGDVNSVLANLQGMKGNPYAGNMASQLMTQRMAEQNAQNKALREMQAKLQMEPMLAAARQAAEFPYKEKLMRIAAGNSQSGQPLQAVIDQNTGEPVFVPRQQAIGMTPATTQDPLVREQAKKYALAQQTAATSQAGQGRFADITKQALEVNPQAMSGGLIPTEWKEKLARNTGIGKDSLTANAKLQALLGGNALADLKATFGGNPTEGERAIKMMLAGFDLSKTAEERAEYIKTAKQMYDSQVEQNQREAAIIGAGLPSYMTQKGQQLPMPQVAPDAAMQPPMMAPNQAQQPTAQPARRAFNPATGRIE